jgi:hypothetical protein
MISSARKMSAWFISLLFLAVESNDIYILMSVIGFSGIPFVLLSTGTVEIMSRTLIAN